MTEKPKSVAKSRETTSTGQPRREIVQLQMEMHPEAAAIRSLADSLRVACGGVRCGEDRSRNRARRDCFEVTNKQERDLQTPR